MYKVLGEEADLPIFARRAGGKGVELAAHQELGADERAEEIWLDLPFFRPQLGYRMAASELGIIMPGRQADARHRHHAGIGLSLR